MAQTKKPTTKKATSTRGRRKASTKAVSRAMSKKRPQREKLSFRQRSIWILTWPYRSIKNRVNRLKARRPHRSFRLTRRRDYVRSLKLPGYWSFTIQVFSVLGRRRKLYFGIALLYAVLVIAFGGMTSQTTYSQLGDLVREGGQDVFTGSWGKIGEAGLLALTAFSGGSGNVSDVQQIYFGLFLILTWLTTVWLLREQLAGRKPRLRDGLYNASAPLVSTMLVALMFIIQLVPFGLLAAIYAGFVSVGIVGEGITMMAASAAGIVAVALTLYWLVSTFFALVIVTLPGMYPMRALTAAGDLVVGRRLRIMYRLVWMLLLALLFWLVVIIPSVLFFNWLQSVWTWLESVPIVPFIATFVSSLTIVGVAAYIYLLYRKVVDDDAAPA